MKKLSYLIGLAFLFSSLNLIAKEECTQIENVRGYTPVAESNQLVVFNWLVFSQGKVLTIGTGKSNQDFKNCIKIDGNNQYMLPGLSDAHGHVSDLGYSMLMVNLYGVESVANAIELIKKFAQENTMSPWIEGDGWNQVLWLNKEFPSKKSLDKTNIKRPIFLYRQGGHAAWANSRALEIAGITRDTQDPQGGKIIRDNKGDATGVLIDNAIDLVYQKIPKPSLIQQEFAFNKAFDHLLSLGITSVHHANVGQDDLDFYRKRIEKSNLPIRIYGMLSGYNANLSQWLDAGIIQDDQDLLSIRSVKLFADGDLGSRGAALLAPYSDDADNKGLLTTEPLEFKRLVKQILNKGFQVNTHAIGDRGNRSVLDTYEEAFKVVGGKGLRNRIEHAQVISLDDIPRFKELNIIASMQPIHATSDKNMAGVRIGSQRLKGAYAWQKLLQQGTVIASGSDFPVEQANIFHGIHAAVTRQDRQNQPEGGWLANNRMSVTQALRSFTLDAAFAAHQEKTLGSLEPGKWADFVIIDQDIIKVNPQNIWKTRVLQTWIAGQKKFDIVE